MNHFDQLHSQHYVSPQGIVTHLNAGFHILALLVLRVLWKWVRPRIAWFNTRIPRGFLDISCRRGLLWTGLRLCWLRLWILVAHHILSERPQRVVGNLLQHFSFTTGLPLLRKLWIVFDSESHVSGERLFVLL